MSRPPSSARSTTPVVRTPEGDAVQLSLIQFLQDVLPPLPDDVDPTQLVNRLRTQRAITSKGRWRGFADDPADSWQHENASFRYLKSAVHSILKASGRASSVSFRQNPNGAPGRDQRDGPFPNALLLAEEELDWNSVVTVGELRKRVSDEDLQENECKITASMANCFYHDPRRRFLYAFTIENTSMRLWFCDRSQVVVSDAFNFITDHEPFVHFFASMMFAKPEEYGLDPTIKRVGNSERYDITIQPVTGVARTFRTLERLYGGGAEFLRGSGTRVWKVTELKDGKESERTMALKDSWVDPERQPEGSIYERFNRATDAVKRDCNNPSPFLTVECHGDVYLDGHTRDVLDCTRRPAHVVVPLGNCTVKSRDELIDPAPATFASHRPKQRLVHYRIVFKEVGKSLDREKSLPRIFQALSHAVLALREMHKIGWVHRDVSAGNILVRDNGDPLLGDLEFAKIMNEGEETRVGTSSFMAIEVASQHYGSIFQIGLPATPIRELYPELKDRFEKRAAHIKALRDAMKNPSAPESQAYIHRPPSPLHFRYNPLHDLESIWWIAMYFLVKKEIVDPRLGSDVNIASEAQRDYASRLFRYHDEMCRRDTLFLANEFLKGMETLPEHVSGIAHGLSFLRDELLEHYTAQEADPSMIDHTCADGLHERFHEMLQNIANAEEISTFVVRPFTYVPHSKADNDGGWRLLENASEGQVPIMWRPYRGHGFYTPTSSGSLKRSVSNTPSDPSIDYDQFQEVKRAKLVDPAQAGAANRVRPYLARRAKTRTQNQSRKDKERKRKR